MEWGEEVECEGLPHRRKDLEKACMSAVGKAIECDTGLAGG